MRTNSEPTFVHTSNIGEVRKASIKTSAKMFNFFSKQIYSNFFVAAWRELVSNGIDAQKVNGSTRRPIVTVPSFLEPYAKVRDFGTGMGHSFMMDKFMSFGDATTKENSDEFIGGFGIGSKAPLAYTDQYAIRSFQNGTVRVYSVFKDDEGCPAIAFLSESDTDEPDGVEVAFPVRQDDIQKFIDSVVETLEYFDPQPLLENTPLVLEPVKYDVRGSKWGMRVTGARTPKVIIGGVGYPLNVSQIPYDRRLLREFSGFGLDLYLNIGDANIALSREQITHDEALWDKLDALIGNVQSEFSKQISTLFESETTLWGAKKKFADAIKAADYNQQNLLRKHAVWKGEKLSVHIQKPKDTDLMVVCYGSFGHNDGMSSMPVTKATNPTFKLWVVNSYFGVNTFDRIVIDDAPDKPILRFRSLQEQFPTEKILVLRDNSEKRDLDMKKVLRDLGSPPASMIDYLSKYTPIKIVRAAPGQGVQRPFKCYVRDNSPYRNSAPDTALPVDGGMYIQMENFDSQEKSSDIQMARLAQPKNIVWLNKTDFEASGVKTNPLFFSVAQAIEKVKANYKSKHKNLEMAEAYHKWAIADKSGLKGTLEKLSKNPGFPKQGPIFQLNRLRLAFESVSDSANSDIRVGLLGVKYDDKLKEVLTLVDACCKKHPLIVICAKDYYLFGKLTDPMINRLF